MVFDSIISSWIILSEKLLPSSDNLGDFRPPVSKLLVCLHKLQLLLLLPLRLVDGRVDMIVPALAADLGVDVAGSELLIHCLGNMSPFLITKLVN